MAETPRGLWIWQLDAIAPDYLDRLHSCSVGRIYLKVLDGDSFWTHQCTTDIVAQIKSTGAQVFGWGYHYAKEDPSGEVAALERAQGCGLDGYVVDIEKEAETPSAHANVQRLLDQIRRLPNALPLGYSSFGAPQYHDNMPWEILNKGTDFCLPQIYFELWTFKPTPAALVEACMDANRALPSVRQILPVWGSEDTRPPSVNPASAATLQALLDEYDGSSIWRVPEGRESGQAWVLSYDGNPARSPNRSGPEMAAAAPLRQPTSSKAPLLCAQPLTKPVPLPAGLAPEREAAIEIVRDKWVNGTILHYCFLQSSNWQWPDAQKDVVRWAFKTWKDLGIGLAFVEVEDSKEAEICIGASQTDGSWSYIGTDVLKYKDQGRTMNFGWDLRTEWGHATALHEIGHTFGLAHEHQNPKAGIVWNEAAVYAAFSAPPNSWPNDTIFHNILEKIPGDTIEGSTWSPDSIMEYPFDPGLIVAPKPYDTSGVPSNTTLAQSDIAWVKSFYPDNPPTSAIAPMELRKLSATSGAQSNFVFQPAATRDYKVQTLGQSDTKVVIFEEQDGRPRFLTAGDNSGVDANVALNVRLVKGRKYTIRVRTHFVSGDGAGLIIV